MKHFPKSERLGPSSMAFFLWIETCECWPTGFSPSKAIWPHVNTNTHWLTRSNSLLLKWILFLPQFLNFVHKNICFKKWASRSVFGIFTVGFSSACKCWWRPMASSLFCSFSGFGAVFTSVSYSASSLCFTMPFPLVLQKCLVLY